MDANFGISSDLRQITEDELRDFTVNYNAKSSESTAAEGVRAAERAQVQAQASAPPATSTATTPARAAQVMELKEGHG